MKCICGYEGTRAIFIRVIFGSDLIGEKESGQSFDYKKVAIFACPKCGTLKIEMPQDWEE